MKKITDDILYIGVNDYDTDLFEGQYPIPEGITYNSYVIIDEKIMVVATSSRDLAGKWLENLEAALEGRHPDYLLMQHMEPDHSAAFEAFMKSYPETRIVASKAAFTMISNYFGTDYSDTGIAVKDGDVLSLGKHEICFLSAPMVHWPEVMLAYDTYDKVLFSADAFGRFGAPEDKDLSAADPAFEAEDWLSESRRYYIGIVGKYGDQVQGVLKKASSLDIRTICALHGPVLTKGLESYLKAYDTWSSYTPEDKGIAICYSSVYGHTKEAVLMLKDILEEKYKGRSVSEDNSARELKIEVFDLARCDISEASAAAFRYDRVILATTTYNNGIFPCMRDFIYHLKDSAFKNRRVALIENGSWAPKAASVMKDLLSDCPGIDIADNIVTIKSAINQETREQLSELAEEMLS